jgi:cytochrome c-type biogenesis protein CcmH
MNLLYIFLALIAGVLSMLLLPLLRNPHQKFILPVVIFITLPVATLATYLQLGSPELPGQPYATRKHDANFALAAQAESLAFKLSDNPSREGYEQLAKLYLKLHRYGQAAEIYLQLGEMAKAKAVAARAIDENK